LPQHTVAITIASAHRCNYELKLAFRRQVTVGTAITISKRILQILLELDLPNMKRL